MVARAVIISIILHFILATATYMYEPPPLSSNDNQRITIDWMAPTKAAPVADPGIISNLNPTIEELKKKALFLSRETVRVKKQMKADNLGYNANSLNPNRRLNLKVRPKKVDQNQKTSRISALTNGDFSVGKRSQVNRFHSPVSISVKQLPSSYIHDLPDGVKPGPMTALNTDQHLYYSFYNRANELVYHRWVEEVGDTIRGRRQLSQDAIKPGRYSTTLKIFLDSEGNYELTEIYKSCGIDELDRALQYAFKKARKIPHPPDGILEDDGRVHLLYTVHVDYFPRR